MKFSHLSIIAAAAGLAVGGAYAQPPAGGPPPSGPWAQRGAAMDAAKTACEPDMKTLCAGKTGREAMMCMHENHDKVSQTCKDAVAKIHGPRIDFWRKRMEDRRAAMEAAKKACEPDMTSLCAGKTGREAMMCMHDNRDKVSQACKDAMAKVRHHHHRRFGHRWMHRGWMRGGPQDYSLGTGFAPPSPEQHAAMDAAKAACAPDMKTLCAGKTGRDAMMCMGENRDKVSQACKDAMAKARPYRGMPLGPRGPGGPPSPAH